MKSHDDALDQKVNDLRERMRLLQMDRRANVEFMEANNASTSSEIRALRDENKKLRLKLTQLQKRLVVDRGAKDELATCHKESVQLRTEYDSLRVTSTKYQRQLEKLKDDAKLCELESQALDEDSGPISKRIKSIENKLDNVLLKYNEAQSIRNTYEHIVKRLREEKLTFNNQLTALERTINSKNRDFDELMKLSADANRAREVAQSELLQARNAFEDRQTKRAADMKEREQVVKIRKQMLEKQERRDAKRKDVLDHKDKLKRDTNELSSHSDAMFLDEKSVRSQENKLNLYEETFNKIKHVTGVSSVDEIIMKIKDQKSTKETLESLVQQNILHIEKLKEEEDALSKDLEQKETISNSSTISKKIMDEAEESHAVTLSNFDKAKNKYERISAILMNAKSGVKHLQERVEKLTMNLSIEMDKFEEGDLGTALWSTGNVLVELTARIREAEMNRLHDIDIEEVDIHTNEDEISSPMPFNQRIVLPSTRGGYSDDENSLDTFADAEDDEWSREKVKKSSSYILRIEKKKQAKEAPRSGQ